jgi:hypothetical protein
MAAVHARAPVSFALCSQLLVVFLVEMLNWHDIVYVCQSEQTCQDINLVVPDWWRRISLFRLVYWYLLFTLYWLWNLLQFLGDLRPLFEMHALFRDKLHLQDSDLQVVAWDEIVVKVVELQKTARLCIVKDQLTAHDIANRILRKENFLVALVNQGLLPLQPLGPSMPSVMTKTLEWSLYVTLLDAMFDRQFRIRQSFTLDVGALRRRFLLCGWRARRDPNLRAPALAAPPPPRVAARRRPRPRPPRPHRRMHGRRQR